MTGFTIKAGSATSLSSGTGLLVLSQPVRPAVEPDDEVIKPARRRDYHGKSFRLPCECWTTAAEQEAIHVFHPKGKTQYCEKHGWQRARKDKKCTTPSTQQLLLPDIPPF